MPMLAGAQWRWSTNNPGSKPPWWFWMIFLVAGAGLLAGGFFALRATQQFLGKADSAPGVITGYHSYQDDDGGTLYTPVVGFTAADGQQYEFSGETGSSFQLYKVGREVTVLYDPENPANARLKSFGELWFLPTLLLAMGVIFLLVSGGGYLAFARAAARAARRAAEEAEQLRQARDLISSD